MARQTKRKQAELITFPILKTVKQMSKISGIGEKGAAERSNPGHDR